MALTFPAAHDLRADSLSDVLDDFIEDLTDSQRDPLGTALSASRVECEDEGDADACRLMALRHQLLRPSGAEPTDPAAEPPAPR
jgi:hypothetical protein